MRYISTRNNHGPASSLDVIHLGMVPEGGLFVPESVPEINRSGFSNRTYQDAANQIFSSFLGEFSSAETDQCISRAYNGSTFDSEKIVPVVRLDDFRSIMELWHGPTAAFKDVALQVMPHFMATVKRTLGNALHTVILVATSGDTGKAALEGFKNCEGISIIVFYPHEGVSEIQKLQMATTDGANTHVVAVKGNFDHCQTGVKRLLSSEPLRKRLFDGGFEFSSANSINWGRLCPQIAYYWTSYYSLVDRGIIRDNDTINFCVPTGNFGNILAGYYAQRMGLPINKLICASNKNMVLTDFFDKGLYDSNRTFYRTTSPSMDILISSNLERFLFEITGHDAAAVNSWSQSLVKTGRFSVDPATKKLMDRYIVAGWVDEQEVQSTIGQVWQKTGMVIDTHTAVAVAVSGRNLASDARHTIIASTASPFKFSRDVLSAMCGDPSDDEFHAIERISSLSGQPVHRALASLRDRPARRSAVIEKETMEETVISILDKIEL